MTKEIEHPYCPLRKGLKVLGGRWPLIILSTLTHASRYGEIKRNIPDISEKMLIQTLRSLEEHKLIQRKDYQEIPPRVEYSITPKGNEALKIIPLITKLSL